MWMDEWMGWRINGWQIDGWIGTYGIYDLVDGWMDGLVKCFNWLWRRQQRGKRLKTANGGETDPFLSQYKTIAQWMHQTAAQTQSNVDAAWRQKENHSSTTSFTENKWHLLNQKLCRFSPFVFLYLYLLKNNLLYMKAQLKPVHHYKWFKIQLVLYTCVVTWNCSRRPAYCESCSI